MAERQSFETTVLPIRTLLGVAGVALVVVVVSLLAMMGLYRLWTNGKQDRVQPGPIANAAAPLLETTQFRMPPEPATPDPAAAKVQGYRWRDPAHTRVDIPVERAMALVAARGAQGFDPPPGAADQSGKAP